MSAPSPLLRLLFRLPAWLYRWRLGWILGTRFIMVTHREEDGDPALQTVLEVARFDPDIRESVVASAFGEGADWYRNLAATPALWVQTGRFRYRARQRFLTDDEARQVAIDYCRSHPLAKRLIPWVLPAIGAVPKGTQADAVDLFASFPMVAFRPKG